MKYLVILRLGRLPAGTVTFIFIARANIYPSDIWDLSGYVVHSSDCWFSWASDRWAWDLDRDRFVTSLVDIVTACAQLVMFLYVYEFDIIIDHADLEYVPKSSGFS